jgi:hypothetical protein
VVAFRDFLTRFRPVGAPGPGTAAGVPVDRSAEVSAELEPPLALLRQAEDEAQRVRERAAAEADRRRRTAEALAEETVARARAGAAQVRARSAERVRLAAGARAAELIETSERDARRVRRRAQERMPALVDRVVAAVSRELGLPRPPGPADGRL